MARNNAATQSQMGEWHFRECGNHFHAELEVAERVFPAGTLTKGCCWPTAHRLKRTDYGYTATTTEVEGALVAALADRMPATALGHALGLAAAYYQHRIGGVPYDPVGSDWQCDQRAFTGKAFPAIGVATDVDGHVCPLLLLGVRDYGVDAIPLVAWSREGQLDLAAGHAVASFPARSVAANDSLALETISRLRQDISDAEEHRERTVSLLNVLYPHLATDADMAPIFIAGLLHRHLATARSGKFDQQCRELLDGLTMPDGEPFLYTQTGTYLAIVHELQRWVAPLENALQTGAFEALAKEMNFQAFAPRLAMMLHDLQLLQQGVQPYLHREPSPENDVVTSLILAGMEGAEPTLSRPTTPGAALEVVAPVLHRTLSRIITHEITDPLGAFSQALADYVSREDRLYQGGGARH